MATKVTPDLLQLSAAGGFYIASGQALAATETLLTLGTSASNPTLVLPTKSLILLTMGGTFNTGGTTYYPHWFIKVSTDNATFRHFTPAELIVPGTAASALGVNGFNNITTAEQAGPLALTGMIQLAAGTYYFRPCHTAGLATGTISYSVLLQAANLSYQA